jgi:DNA-binding transcriptional LysR family regulator
LGVTALPRLTMPLIAADLVWRPLNEPVLHRHIRIVTPARRSLAPAARAFLDELVDEVTATNRKARARSDRGEPFAVYPAMRLPH